MKIKLTEPSEQKHFDYTWTISIMNTTISKVVHFVDSIVLSINQHKQVKPSGIAFIHLGIILCPVYRLFFTKPWKPLPVFHAKLRWEITAVAKTFSSKNFILN